MREKPNKFLSKKIVICIDLGSSLIKVLYRVGELPVKYLLFDPEYIALPPESAANLPRDSGMGWPEDNAWVRYVKNGECHLVGRTARDYRVGFNFKALKKVSIVPKVLAAIGTLAQSENLGRNFQLDLGVLLPWGEISAREELQSSLKAALSGFYFRHTYLRVKLQQTIIAPEASGAAMLDQQRGSYFIRHNCAYLMFGHRNTSLLFFRKGTLSKRDSSTTNLGFVDLIDKMRARVPGLERNDVLLAFSTSMTSNLNRRGEDTTITTINWSRVTQERDEDKASVERRRLSDAYEIAIKEYWQLLVNWLDDCLPPRAEIDAVIRCGGASELLTPYIGDFFQDVPQYVPFGYTNQLMSALDLSSPKSPRASQFIAQNLPTRLADVWGLFVVFTDSVELLLSKEENLIAAQL